MILIEQKVTWYEFKKMVCWLFCLFR